MIITAVSTAAVNSSTLREVQGNGDFRVLVFIWLLRVVLWPGHEDNTMSHIQPHGRVNIVSRREIKI
jgi:hypothetical protein